MRLRPDRPEGVGRAAWAVAHLLARRSCCPRDLTRADIYEYRGRIRDLREAGAVVAVGKCQRHDHPYNPRMPSYRLISVPDGWHAGVTV